MKTKISIFFLLALWGFFSFAQNDTLTIEQAAYYYWWDLAPDDLLNLQWQPVENNLSYISNDYKKILIIKDFFSTTDTLLTLEEFNSLSPKKLNYLYYYEWLDKDNLLIFQKNFYAIYNIKQKKVLKSLSLPEDAENIFYNHKAKTFAYTIENNLYISNWDGYQTAITNDTNKGIVNGDDYVHRQEFGIDHGIFWSPKGNFIAFYRKDETMVYDYPLVDFTSFPAKPKFIKYPMTGQKSEEVTLGIYDLKAHKTIFLEKKGDPEHYLTCVSWDPSEKFIYIAELNRDQNFLKLNKYDVKTGKLIKTLFTEKNSKYVEPEHPLYFSPDGKKFIWFSERDGYQHLYLYTTDGKLLKQLTKGKWVVTEFYGFSDDGNFIYFQATKESPLDRHIYKLNIKTGQLDKLTTDSGYHEATFNSDFSMFIDSYSSTEIPHNIFVVSNSGQILNKLLISPNKLASYKMPTIKIGTITAADKKTKLYYRLILPPDLDTTKKYPVLLYVYGGPHVQLITNSWLADASPWLIYMAQKGYVVFTVDNRGSDNRGFKFESVIYRHLGIEEMKDQMQGIKFLKSLPFVDTNRIGVHGWSFGGFMTLSLLTTYPDVFKVGVAGGPVTDWKYYEVMYGERYMDTPQDNPDGYKQSSVIEKIGNLKAKTLVIHGMIDPVVVPQNSMDLLLQAQNHNIQIDFYAYPNTEHNVKGELRIHLYKKITAYFDQNL